MKNNLSNASPFTKLLIIIGVFIGSFLVINIIGIILPVPFIKGSLISFLDIFRHIDYRNHYHVNILKYLQIVQAIGMFVVPPVILAYVFSSDVRDYLKINNNAKLLYYLLAVLIIIASLPLIDWMSAFNSRLKLPHQLIGLEQWMKDSENNAAVVTKAFLNVTTYQGLLLNVFMIAVLPAIGEEFLFRGLLIRLFKEWSKNIHIAVIISAFLFSAIHFQFYGFIPRMMLGILLGYLFVWSGSIWVPVIAHFTNNVTAVIVSYLNTNGYISVDTDNMFSIESNYLLLVVCIIITASLITLFYIKTKGKEISQKTEL